MSNQNQNFVAPQGSIQGPAVIPTGGNAKTRRTDIQNLPSGLNPGILVGLVDLGTQEVSFGGGPVEMKRQMKFIFEHPQLKQYYYEEDTEQRTHTTMKTSTFSTAPKAFLKLLMDAKEGRELDSREADVYDLSSLLGCVFGVMTMQKRSKKNPDNIYDNITGITAIGNYPLPPNFNREHPYNYFVIDTDRRGTVIGQNFLTKNYADVPYWLQKDILSSVEAKQYAQRGGQFAKNPEEQTQHQQAQTPSYPQQNVGQQQQQVQQNPMQNQGQPQSQNTQQYQQQQQAQQPPVTPNQNVPPSQTVPQQNVVQQPQQGMPPSHQPQQQVQGQQFQQPQQQQPQQVSGGFDPDDDDQDDLPF